MIWKWLNEPNTVRVELRDKSQGVDFELWFSRWEMLKSALISIKYALFAKRCTSPVNFKQTLPSTAERVARAICREATIADAPKNADAHTVAEIVKVNWKSYTPHANAAIAAYRDAEGEGL